MNWYAKQRYNWINESLRIYGFINRAHVVEKFGCSNAQAGNDLRLFARENADWVQYDNCRRTYVNIRHEKAVL